MADRRVKEINNSSKVLGKLLGEGYLEPVDEFGLRIETIASMMDTAMSIAADMHSYCESYDKDLGVYQSIIETIQDLLEEVSEQVCAISEDLEEEYGDESEDDESDNDDDKDSEYPEE